MTAITDCFAQALALSDAPPDGPVLAPLHASLAHALQRLLHALRALDLDEPDEARRLGERLSAMLAALQHYRALLLPLLGDPAGWPGEDPQFRLRHLARAVASGPVEQRAQHAAWLHQALAALVAEESARWPADEAAVARSAVAAQRRTEGWLVAMGADEVAAWLPLMADALTPLALSAQLRPLWSRSSPASWSGLIDGLRAPMGEARWLRLGAALAGR